MSPGPANRRVHPRSAWGNGVVFHLEDKASAIEGGHVRLNGGGSLESIWSSLASACGALALAKAGGLTVDPSVAVGAFLETSAPGIFAAGDIALWPGP